MKVTKTRLAISCVWRETIELMSPLCSDCTSMRWDQTYSRCETRDELKKAAARELGIKVEEPGITKPPPSGDLMMPSQRLKPLYPDSMFAHRKKYRELDYSFLLHDKDPETMELAAYNIEMKAYADRVTNQSIKQPIKWLKEQR